MTGEQVNMSGRIEAAIIAELARGLNVRGEKIAITASFLELGVNSVLGVELIEGLNKELGIELGVEVIFDYKTPTELTRHIIQRYYPGGSQAAPNEAPVADTAAATGNSTSGQREGDIAVIGAAGRLPGARTIEEYWANLENGRCSIHEIQRPGWDTLDFYDPDPAKENKSISKWAGLVEDADRFDPLFFNISPREALYMDPQQRLFMEEAYKAFEDSGYTMEQLSGQKVGVFVGCRSMNYEAETLRCKPINPQGFLGSDMSILAARISYYMNLKGPNMAVDTACSSSLAALHLACESIKRGESHLALAGGVFLMPSPDFLVKTSKTEMLSPDGRCKTFDDSANGIVIGEGVGALVLKPLAQALRDGNYIYGVIKGSGLNQDGATKGITAPSPLSQKELIGYVYEKSGIHPETVSCIEAHGTGTKLGDPIEVTALTEAFRAFTDKKQFCVIGSHKPNIGHTIMTAGIAGVFKLLMALKYKKIPPTIGVEKLNRHINFEDSPFFVNTTLLNWERKGDTPRRAGISSFGFSGTNCHIIIEEAPDIPPPGRPANRSYELICLSARSIDALERKVRSLAAWLDSAGDGCELADVSYTLLVGRSHFPRRVACVAGDIADLKRKLKDLLEKGAVDGITSAPNEKTAFNREYLFKELGKRLIEEIIDPAGLEAEVCREKMSALAELYVMGSDPGWQSLFKQGMYRRIPLPAYPFYGERYRIDGDKQVPAPSTTGKKVEAEEFTYIPLWRRQTLGSDHEFRQPASPASRQTVLLIFSPPGAGLAGALENAHSGDEITTLDLEQNSISSLDAYLQQQPPPDLVYFLGVGDPYPGESGLLPALEKSQEWGTLSLFHLVRLLFKHRLERHPLTLKVIAANVYLVESGDRINPMGAGLLGLVRSLAKEVPAWKISALDIAPLDPVNGEKEKQQEQAGELAGLARSIRNEPAHPHGTCTAIRTGQRYIRSIEPVTLPAAGESFFRQDGVYMIIGGAGGLGLELGLYLARAVRARLALVGRSPLTGEQKRKIAQIEACGGQVLYTQADVAQPGSLKQAAAEARQAFGRLHGVIHSAMAVKNGLLRDLDEETFKSVLAAKVMGSVVLHQVFSKQPLDFILFFSSSQSFIGSGGMSGYVSGCAFTDAYALYMDQVEAYPVKVINWGYFGGISLALNAELHKHILNQGFFPLEPGKTLALLPVLLGTSARQLIHINAGNSLLMQMGVDTTRRWIFYPPTIPPLVQTAVDPDRQPIMDTSAQQRLEQTFAQLEGFYRCKLLSVFQDMGVFRRAGETYDVNTLKQQLAITPAYEQLYRVLLTILTRAGFIRVEDSIITALPTAASQVTQEEIKSLPHTRQRLLTEPNGKEWANLLWICLEQYPHLLRGQAAATDIMFPNSSMELVESIYKGNTAADYYNQLVVWGLLSYIRARLPLLPVGKKLKILEIGAGTGGTSAVVLPALHPYADRLEYIYTDISPGFTRYGKSRYGEHNPFVVFKVLDIEKKVSPQGYVPGDCDILVATNVLHATRCIRDTLANARILLKTNGLLIINELTEVKDFLSLTFGLLEGWWLYEDEAERLPGSPLLAVETWERLLREEGFANVVVLKSHTAHGKAVTQHVLMGESNGLVRQDLQESTPVVSTRPMPMKAPGIAPSAHRATAQTSTSPGSQVPDGDNRDILKGHIEDAIIRSLSTNLQIDKNEFDPEAAYSDFGVDSILAIEIVTGINEMLGIHLRSTDLFNYSTISRLMDHIAAEYADSVRLPAVTAGEDNSQVAGGEENEVVEAEAPAGEALETAVAIPTDPPQPRPGRTPVEIAVIGISGRFPGAGDIDCLWENLAAGKNSIAEITRWDLNTFYDPAPQVPGKSCSRWGGFLAGSDKFDPLFFNISPKEAELMDPQQRLFLEEAWRALEDAGYSDRILDGKKCGVFLGYNYSDYRRMMDQEQLTPEAYTFMGNSESILSSRISYFLNLRGPAVTVNTACSASLVSVHLACESIYCGTSELAVAGGISLLNTPDFYIMASQTGMLSPRGQCRAFDNGADGFVPGEGVGVLVLKPLEAAQNDGNHIYGIIAGSGINQDGKSNGITAPSATSQTALECEVYEKYRIDPETITYIETHGTGTRLGDPIEMDALTDAFRRYTAKTKFCAVGSIKTNIGHTLASAGVCGLIKLLLCLDRKKLVPSLHFDIPNSFINFKDSPFYVNTQFCDWQVPGGGPRQGAVSSFGFSGTNAHVVVKEAPVYPLAAGGGPLSPFYIIPISAKTEAGVKEKWAGLAAWLGGKGKEELLPDISYTLLVGRSHFNARSVLIAQTKEELAADIKGILAGAPPEHYREYLRKGTKFKGEPVLQQLAHLLTKEIQDPGLPAGDYREKLLAMADLYTKGYDLEWPLLYRQRRCRLLSMPTYPFAGESYWIPRQESSTAISRPVGQPPVVLHPLLHINTSTLREQGYTTILTGREFFLADHVIAGQRTFPGVGYIEMARAAGEMAGNAKVQKIKNIFWASPIYVDRQDCQVRICLIPGRDALDFEVSTGSGENHRIHARGKLVLAKEVSGTRQDTPLAIDLEAIKNRCPRHLESADYYQRFHSAGIVYGPSFKPIRQLVVNTREALGLLELPTAQHAEFNRFVLHPSLMDGALQTVAGMMAQLGDGAASPYLPFCLDEIDIIAPLTQQCYAYASAADIDTAAGDKNDKESSPISKFNLQILDLTGRVLVKIRNFTVRALKSREVQTLPTAMYFREIWTSVSFPALSAPPPGKVVVAATDRWVLRQLSSQGDRVIPVLLGSRFQVAGGGYEVNVMEPGDFHRLVQDLAGQGEFPSRIVFWAHHETFSYDETGLNRQVEVGMPALLYLSQALLGQKTQEKIRLAYVYFGWDGEFNPLHGAVSGFARSLRRESQKFLYKTVEIQADPGTDGPTQDNPAEVSRFFDLLQQELTEIADDHQEVRYEGKDLTRRVKRMQAVTKDEMQRPGFSYRAGGVYLITGGLGSLGLITAKHLAAGGAVKLVLTDCSPLTPPKSEKIEELKRLGSEVVYVQADISRESEVRRLVEESIVRFKELHGVIHCAGMIRDSLVQKKTREEVAEVLAPKIWGTAWLDKITREQPLEFFILFSSAAAVLGNLGQSDYAYANRFMDHFAVRREQLRQKGQRRGKSLSINWPLWKQGGMQIDAQTETWLEKHMGMTPMTTVQGLEAFDWAIAGEDAQVAVMVGDPVRVYEQMGIEPVHRAPAPPVDVTPGKTATEPLSPESLREKVEQDLLALCSDLLKVNRGDLDPDERLGEYGLDSIIMMTLLNRLEALYGTTVEANVLVEHDHIRSLAAYLVQEGIVQAPPPSDPGSHPGSTVLSSSPSSSPSPSPSPFPSPFPSPSLSSGYQSEGLDPLAIETNGRPRFLELPVLGTAASCTGGKIAVIGMACRFPQSENTEQFWDHLINGRTLVSEIPPDRWSLDRFYNPDKNAVNRSYSKWGGFIRQPYAFDADYFHIAEDDAVMMDPHHRILLELADELFSRSGYSRQEVDNASIGVYIGGGESAYVNKDTSQLPELYKKHMLVNWIQPLMAARIADFYNLKGMAQTLDTACSSSLVAIHQACQAIRLGECDMAIAGGVELHLNPYLFIGFSKADVLADDGICYVFDERAKGIVLGEGGGVVLLKSYEKALRDGDSILAVIRGGMVNNDGHTMGLTVPSQEGQKEVIRLALERSSISADTITLLEAHGTGTLLGDPIEIKAATQVYREFTGDKQYCPVGSVKSNMGHLMRAAGIASFIKVVLALQHCLIPPTLHCTRPHPRFKFSESPFYPVTRLTEWQPRQGFRRAGVSSFGFGGTNCHMILEEFSGAPGYRPQRQALPVRNFQRKIYRLGEPVTAAAAPVPAASLDGIRLMKLLKELKEGHVDTHTALEQIKEVFPYSADQFGVPEDI